MRRSPFRKGKEPLLFMIIMHGDNGDHENTLMVMHDSDNNDNECIKSLTISL